MICTVKLTKVPGNTEIHILLLYLSFDLVITKIPVNLINYYSLTL